MNRQSCDYCALKKARVRWIVVIQVLRYRKDKKPKVGTDYLDLSDDIDFVVDGNCDEPTKIL